ncbi:MAG: S41 family peptidase [Flavobacteriales bacterium TMED288]|nr:peptidase S41 [Flavobacteriales bacterium]RPG53040.1 MAG: S41 family peptidase [Flavobacteriales bacterium TMED288]
MKKQFFLFLLPLALCSSILISFSNDTEYFEVSKNLDIFNTLFKEVNIFYVDKVQPAKMVETAINSMLKELDPYTTYIPESDIEDFKFQTTGQYGGIGAVIRKKDDYVIIVEPYKGFPADISGLVAGDKLIEIDGNSVKGKSTEEVSSILKGQPGIGVEVLIERRGNSEYLTKKLTRDKIKVNSIPYKGVVSDNIGYIKLRSFTRNCANEVKRAILSLKKQNNLQGLILDLRGNPGGLLNESINICNLFMAKGLEVVSTKGKIDDWDKSYKTRQEPVDKEIPLVILINQSSASASEIVSGTLQDIDRAVIIGQKSFGKGLVQQTRKLSYNSQLKVTVAKYYTPSGRCIQALDYSNKNKNGSVGKTPDSLKNEFYTLNGRKVYDGGGIDPDIRIKITEAPEILISLISNQLIFDYATEYFLLNDTFPIDFDQKDDYINYENFVDFVSDKDLKYKTQTEQSFSDLVEVSKKEYSKLQDPLSDVEKLLNDLKKNDIYKHKDEILKYISQELLVRSHYREGAIKSSLNYDEAVLESISVLSDTAKYYSILSIND